MLSFEHKIKEIRARAREHMDAGPVTAGYAIDPNEMIKLLNSALATEIVCVMRYRNHYYAAQGIAGGVVAEEFLEHANEEQLHVDWLAERIDQLQGTPNYDPKGLAERSFTEYSESDELDEMIREDLVGERIVIELYREMIAYIAEKDPTTRKLLENILKDEEEHADDLLKLLKTPHTHYSKSGKRTESDFRGEQRAS